MTVAVPLRLLGLAGLVIGTALASQPAAGQENLREFMLRESGDGVYSLECFQAGQKVMSETGLRIDLVEGRRLMFVDQDGRPINIVQAVGAHLLADIRQVPGGLREYPDRDIPQWEI